MKKLLILLISILLYGQIFGQLNVKTRKFNSGGANVFDTLSLGSYCFIQAADSAWIEKPKGTWFASLTQGGGTTNYIGNDYLKLPGDGTAKNKFTIDLDRGNENAGWYYYWLNTAETWGLYMHLDATGYGFAGLGQDAWSQIFVIDPENEFNNTYSIAINSATDENGDFNINKYGAHFQRGIQLNYGEVESSEVPGYIRYNANTGNFEGYNGLTSSWTSFGSNLLKVIKCEYDYTQGNGVIVAGDAIPESSVIKSVFIDETSALTSSGSTGVIYMTLNSSGEEEITSINADDAGIVFEYEDVSPSTGPYPYRCVYNEGINWFVTGTITAGHLKVYIEYYEP